jgi:hypothetical protein
VYGRECKSVSLIVGRGEKFCDPTKQYGTRLILDQKFEFLKLLVFDSNVPFKVLTKSCTNFGNFG